MQALRELISSVQSKQKSIDDLLKEGTIEKNFGGPTVDGAKFNVNVLHDEETTICMSTHKI